MDGQFEPEGNGIRGNGSLLANVKDPGAGDALPTSSEPELATPCFAYLSDPGATAGAAGLLTDKRRLDGFAERNRYAVVRYVVDSGRADGPPAPGRNLVAMIGEAAAGSVPVLLIARADALAPTPALAEEVMKWLEAKDIRLIDVSEHEAKGVPAEGKRARSASRVRARAEAPRRAATNGRRFVGGGSAVL